MLSSLTESKVWRKKEHQKSTRTMKAFSWADKHVKYQLEINHITFCCSHIAFEKSMISDSHSEVATRNL